MVKELVGNSRTGSAQ